MGSIPSSAPSRLQIKETPLQFWMLQAVRIHLQAPIQIQHRGDSTPGRWPCGSWPCWGAGGCWAGPACACPWPPGSKICRSLPGLCAPASNPVQFSSMRQRDFVNSRTDSMLSISALQVFFYCTEETHTDSCTKKGSFGEILTAAHIAAFHGTSVPINVKDPHALYC